MAAVEGGQLADPVPLSPAGVSSYDPSITVLDNGEVRPLAVKVGDTVVFGQYAGSNTIECCSVSKSTFTYDGNPVGGAAKKPLITYPVTLEEETLKIKMAR